MQIKSRFLGGWEEKKEAGRGERIRGLPGAPKKEISVGRVSKEVVTFVSINSKV